MHHRNLHHAFASAFLLLVLAGLPARAEVHTVRPPHPHEQMECAPCHASTVRIGPETCRDCHATAAQPAGMVGFHAERARACVDCHVFHDPQVIRTGAESTQLTRLNAGVRWHCTSCHGQGSAADLSRGHQVAAGLYHTRTDELENLSPSQGCLLCHAPEGGWLPWVGTLDVPRFAPHATHPYGVAMQATPSLRRIPDTRLALFDRRIECQTCHQITADTPDLLVRFDPPYALCQGCHTQQTSTPSVAVAR